MRGALLAAVVLLAAGCATPKDAVWVKAGASSAEFDADAGQCRAQAFSVPGADSTRIAIVYVSCMQGKGWQRQEQ